VHYESGRAGGEKGIETPMSLARELVCNKKQRMRAPTELNERASSDFILRMGVQTSRLVVTPPVLEIREIADEEFGLTALQDLVKEIEVTVGKYFKPGANSAYESVHHGVVRCIKSASIIYGEDEE
jgi:hypothetical protein